MKWTLEKLQEEANKYETRSEFKKNSKDAYLSAVRKKIINDLFKNHNNNGYSTKQKFAGYWTKDKILQELKKCKNRKEFWDNNKLSNAAIRFNIDINEIFKENGYSKKPNGYWTKDKIQEDIKNYKNRYDFYLKNPSAYKIACDLNILDDLFENFPNNGYSDKCNWCHNKYVIYSYELKNYNTVYIGLSNNIDRRDKEHLYGNDNLINFCKKNNISLPNYKILENNLNSKEAKIKELFWINNYRKNNWMLLNVAKGGSLGGFPKKWNITKLQNIVNKYNSRYDFKKNDLKAYNVVIKLKIMDKLFENHPNNGYSNKKHKFGYWSFDRLQDIANKCEFRKDFEKIVGASNAAHKLKVYDKLFKNHPNNGYKKHIIKGYKKQKS